MVKVTLRGLFAHKLRLLLTAIAIVLGVAFVSGTFVLTDTLSGTFDRIFNDAYHGVAVTIMPKGDLSHLGEAPVTIPASVADTVRAVPGVKTADGNIFRNGAIILDPQGNPILTQGAPSFGFGWINSPANAYHILSGRAPRADNEVALDVVTFTNHHFRLGETVQVSVNGAAAQNYQLVGALGFGSTNNSGGAISIAMTVNEAQRRFNALNQYDVIYVESVPGLSDTALRDRIAAVIPGYNVSTGSDAARQAAQQVEQGLGFFGTFLLVFGGIALFVGAFTIVNTFNILVAQRTRELALLRALGATRRQVLALVIAEAFLTGFFASIIGAVAGYFLAKGIFGLLSAFGATLPNDALVYSVRTIAIALAVGTGISVVAAFLPALRATRIAPVAALREAEPELGRVTTRRVIVGIIGTILSLAVLGLGLFVNSGNRLPEIIGGCALLFMGIAVLVPIVVPPIGRLLGTPAAMIRGVPGKLARENAVRNPRRTASTAAALMIGLALVGTISVLASTASASINTALGGFSSDFVVTSVDQTNSAGYFSPTVGDVVRRDPNFTNVTDLRGGVWFDRNGNNDFVGAVDPEALRGVVALNLVSGSLSNFSAGDVFVSDSAAKAWPLTVGDTLPMKFNATAQAQRITVGGIFKANALISDYVLPLSVYDANYKTPTDVALLINNASGKSQDAALSELKADLKGFPTLKAETKTQYLGDQVKQINSLINLFDVLIGLAVVIAFLGIVNTLALSIVERYREIGLLRALGLTRRQTRSMIRWEAIIIALLGAVLGVMVGIGLGIAVTSALASEGLGTLSIPVVRLLISMIIAGFAGVLAAIIPARRAAHLNVLDAMYTE